MGLIFLQLFHRSEQDYLTKGSSHNCSHVLLNTTGPIVTGVEDEH